MASLEKPKVFIITYDDGENGQVREIPHKLFNDDVDFRKNIICMKCLSCNFESKFSEEQKS